MTTRGLFLGRFQPLHLGHVSVLETMLVDDELDEIIIGIGSAQDAHTEINPFTAGERFEMISAQLNNMELSKKVHIVPIADIGSNYKYMSYLRTILPHFDVYYGSNKLMHLLCNNAGIKSISVPYHDELHKSGTWIRENIKKNKLDWRDYVPEATVRYILANPRLYLWTEGIE